MTSLNGNTFHVTDTLRGESTDYCNTPEAILGQFDAEWFGPTSATTGRYGWYTGMRIIRDYNFRYIRIKSWKQNSFRRRLGRNSHDRAVRLGCHDSKHRRHKWRRGSHNGRPYIIGNFTHASHYRWLWWQIYQLTMKHSFGLGNDIWCETRIPECRG